MSDQKLDPEKAQRAMSEEDWTNNKYIVAQVWQKATEGTPPHNQQFDFKNKVPTSYMYELENIAEMRQRKVIPEMLGVFDAFVSNEILKAKTMGDVMKTLEGKIHKFSSPQSKNDTELAIKKNDASTMTSIAYSKAEQAIILATMEQNLATHYKIKDAAIQQDTQQS